MSSNSAVSLSLTIPENARSELVIDLYSPDSGAKVIFGDVSERPSLELQTELSPNAHFVKCDTSNYADQLNLFKTAYDLYGKIDVVAANAGISIHQDIFDPALDINEEPSMREVDINLTGTIFSARIGMHYLRKNGGGDLVFTSSIAGFKECGGLVTYTASKHGVIGIMRGLHLTATPENIRVNVICPWMTSKSTSIRFSLRIPGEF